MTSESAIRAGPLVSVIVPAFQAQTFLESAVKSALRQTYSHLEVLIVDDGSTDNTLQIARDIALHDGRVRVLTQPHNGPASARNTALREAHGALIAPLDADDLWNAEKLARQVDALERSDNDYGVAYCWTATIDESDKIIRMPDQVRANGYVFDKLILDCFLRTGSNPIIRRDYMIKVGGYDSQFLHCEDWKLYLALSRICKFVCVPEVLVGYRSRAGSHSSDLKQMRHSFDALQQWLRASVPEASLLQLRQQKAYAHLSWATTYWNRTQLARFVQHIAMAFVCEPLAAGIILGRYLSRRNRVYAREHHSFDSTPPI